MHFLLIVFFMYKIKIVHFCTDYTVLILVCFFIITTFFSPFFVTIHLFHIWKAKKKERNSCSLSDFHRKKQQQRQN